MSARRPTIRLTRDADRDYEDIRLYTRRVWGVAQETRYRSALAQILRSMRDHPLVGQARDDLFPGCRSVNAEQHVIFYHQPHPTEIVVLRILHQRQDPIGKVGEPTS